MNLFNVVIISLDSNNIESQPIVGTINLTFESTVDQWGYPAAKSVICEVVD